MQPVGSEVEARSTGKQLDAGSSPVRFFLINVRFVVFVPQIIIGLSRLGGIHIVYYLWQ